MHPIVVNPPAQVVRIQVCNHCCNMFLRKYHEGLVARMACGVAGEVDILPSFARTRAGLQMGWDIDPNARVTCRLAATVHLHNEFVLLLV